MWQKGAMLTPMKPKYHDEDASAGWTCAPDNWWSWWRLSANLSELSQGLETFRRDRGSCRQAPSCCPTWWPTGRSSSTECFRRRKRRGRSQVRRQRRALWRACSTAGGAFASRGSTPRYPPGFSRTWNIEFWPMKLFPGKKIIWSNV